MDKINTTLKNILNKPAFYIVIVLLIFIFIMYMPKMEKYSQATITQITDGQGAMNTYLSADARKYLPNLYYDGGKNKAFCPEVPERYYPKCFYGQCGGALGYNPKADWLAPYYQG